MILKIKKVLRFLKIYGFGRTLIKIVGRSSLNFPLFLILSFPNYFKKGKKIGVIGTGHHSFSSLAFFLTKYSDFRFLWAYDIDKISQKKFCKTYGIQENIDLPLEKLKKPQLVYIVSNHSTHTSYALKYIKNDIDVFIEKPISTTYAQLESLDKSLRKSSSKVYAGYNRPFSKAMIKVKSKLKKYKNSPITANFFIIGHKIENDHWYRQESEGTRVIGNLGHWIDLSVNLFYNQNRFPSKINIDIVYSDNLTPSENISLTFTTPSKDIICIVFSAREEPFEGVSEFLSFQCDDLIAKIDDFRSVEIWEKEKHYKKKYFPKDNGHKNAALQPKYCDNFRSWPELKNSTRLMLFIEEMVKNRIKSKNFKIKKNEEINSKC